MEKTAKYADSLISMAQPIQNLNMLQLGWEEGLASFALDPQIGTQLFQERDGIFMMKEYF